jgi:hypothetical protein
LAMVAGSVLRGLGCCDGLSLGWGAQRIERMKGTSRALILEGKRRQAGRRWTAMAIGPIHKERRCSVRLPCDERWRRICGSRSRSSWWRRLALEIDELDESRKGTPAAARGSAAVQGRRG